MRRKLVASQVALSMALPFVVLPLLILTGMKSLMRVEEQIDENNITPRPMTTDVAVEEEASPPIKVHLFQNHWALAVLSYAIFGVICVADVYVLATSFN